MTLRTLIRRSLRFHWRSHLGVVIGAAIGSAALIGALVVGDSVKGSLRKQALERIGNAEFAASYGDRTFNDNLASNLNSEFQFEWGVTTAFMFMLNGVTNTEAIPTAVDEWKRKGDPVSAVLYLPASAAAANGTALANSVHVYGTDENFDRFAEEAVADRSSSEGLWVNEALAGQLQVKPGDEVVLRITKPTSISMEATVSPRNDAVVGVRMAVTGIRSDTQLGNFSLIAGQTTPFNAFLPLDSLQNQMGLESRVNLLLARTTTQFKSHDYSGLKALLTKLKSRSSDDLEHVSLRFSSNGVRAYQTEFNSATTGDDLRDYLWKAFSVDDAELEVRDLQESHSIELRTPRVFIDKAVASAAIGELDRSRFGIRYPADLIFRELTEELTNAQPILTYIANLITLGTNATPYSMVTAAGTPWTPPDLADDEIVLNQWLADDLKAKPGDEIRLVYYDPESGANLTERTNVFRVHSIVPMELPWADRTLMPEFPGIEKAETTADWDTAFPLKYKIRSKDDNYWREYRGTPKAFITLTAGKKMWANRFGEVTAIRFPAPEKPLTREVNGELVFPHPDNFATALEWKLLSNLNPAELGLSFEPVREQALQSAKGAQDFGGLFIGFSLFLIAAALILMALLFQFGLEQRASEIGTLLALGFTHKQVRRLLLGEGVALAFIGGVIGMVGGVLYARAMLLGLRTVWSDAVGGTTLDFFVTPVSLLIGLFASTLVAILTIWLALRKQARRPAMALLNTRLGDGLSEMGDRSRACQSADRLWRRLICILTNAATVGFVSLTLAVALIGRALATGETANAGVFFGAGALLLIGGLALVSAWLRRLAGVLPASRRQIHFNDTSSDNEKSDLPAGRRKHISVEALAFRGLARRRSRSVATAALLASGAFLILSIGVFRLDANRDAIERTSGTGGFALMGESTIPVVQDLNSPSGREIFALDENVLNGVDYVQFRVHAGDEASCLNLNRAQKPRLLGVDPAAMEGRFTFAKVAKGLDTGDGWQLLRSGAGDSADEGEQDESVPRSDERGYEGSSAVPAIGDANSIQWAMHKKVGDTLDYVDDRGRPFKVRIVGAVANSILQGNLIIDEAEFVKRFPNESGYQYFLMDAPIDRVKDVSATLSRALQDYGLEMTPAADRLNQFNAVQNTYLGTFQILGGLGLLLGSAGLGIVVLRNVLERRGELAVLMAVGFRKRIIERLVLIEHAGLLGLGLAIGLIAAAVAVLPTLLSPGSQLPYATLLPTVLAVLINGLVWTWVAGRVAMRGNLLEALRNE